MKRNINICKKCRYYYVGEIEGKPRSGGLIPMCLIRSCIIYEIYVIGEVKKDITEEDYENNEVPPDCKYKLEQTVMNQKIDIEKI